MCQKSRWKLGLLCAGLLTVQQGMAADWQSAVGVATADIESKAIAWRHHLHANPELSNREFKTSAMVAQHLRDLGFDEVKTEVAHTGVVGLLKGGKPGKTVALRADMDALPVTEKTGLPYASTVTTEWAGAETGVMHACGHDAHISILMAVAEVLAGMRDEIPGNVMFIFQPAEEGAPAGEEGGAHLMMKQGVLKGDSAPEAIFGLHVFPYPVGTIGYKAEGIMAASDALNIVVKGSQTHGSMPWKGNDPIAASAQVVSALQQVVSRHTDISTAPAVVTVGSINGGNRGNIIPEQVAMTGTIRTFDSDMQDKIHADVKRVATLVAEGLGATAEVDIQRGYPVTYNDPALTAQMVPVFDSLTTGGKPLVVKPVMGAEDFSYFANEIPGFFFFLGVAPDGKPESAPNHSPYFTVNDKAMKVGIESLSSLALKWLHDAQAAN